MNELLAIIEQTLMPLIFFRWGEGCIFTVDVTLNLETFLDFQK